MSRNKEFAEQFDGKTVTSREERVSRNIYNHAMNETNTVTSREGRVSRNTSRSPELLQYPVTSREGRVSRNRYHVSQ